jgi:hypothetical protein
VTVAVSHEARFDAAVDLFGTARALEAAEADLQAKLRDRGIYFGDGLIPTYAFAFVMSREHVARWSADAELLIRAAEHLACRLAEDDRFYDEMGLDREAIELMRIDPGYREICVLCRPDGIPIGGDLKFCELNCDSPAMMMFLDLVGECLLELDAFASLRANGKPASAADRLLDTLVACYREYGGGGGEPTIAITDWDGQKTRYEHRKIAEHFQHRGYATVVTDPRAFRRAGGKLELDGRRIDLVYRRAIASELIERRTEVEALLGAYRDRTICMVNPLRSALAGAKSLLSVIAGGTGLPPELRGAAELVPRTLLLDNDAARAEVRGAPLRWVLKKSVSHGGLGVVLPGVEPDHRDALAASVHETWIAQEYLQIPRVRVPVVREGAVAHDLKYYNWNPFVFGGRYAGGMARVSDTPLINITLGGGLLPMLIT